MDALATLPLGHPLNICLVSTVIMQHIHTSDVNLPVKYVSC